MMRWLAVAAAVVGLLMGMAFPNSAFGNLTGHQLAVTLTPPTLSSGSSPYLTCGWHIGCVDPWTEGYALDWDDGGDVGSSWYFRGFFYVSNANRSAFKMFPLVSQSGADKCDIMTVWITELHSAQLMAIPTFMHVNITNGNSFNWMGGPWTIYNSRQIGTTIEDTGCSWFGSHVHEYHVDYLTSLVAISRNTGYYPTALNCNTICNSHQNNNINKWTRRFAWAEGAAPH